MRLFAFFLFTFYLLAAAGCRCPQPQQQPGADVYTAPPLPAGRGY
jgi:hypothetical protein